MIFIIILIVIGLVAFFSFVAGAGLVIEGELRIEPNKRIRKLKKNKERLKQLERECVDHELCNKYRDKIKEIEKMIQSEIYSEMGIQEDNKE